MTLLAAVIVVAGCATGFWSWRDLWALAGALAGVSIFAFFQAVNPVVPVLIGPIAALFSVSGMALTFGTLFLDPIRGPLERTELEVGETPSPVEAQHRIDTLRPPLHEWLVAGSLAAAGVGLAAMGAFEVFEIVPTLVGLVSLAGPGVAVLRLRREAKQATLLEENLDRQREST